MNRLFFITLLLLSITKINAKQPNVIFILTDDQGWADMSCHGNPDIETPNIDAFFESAAELTNYYVSPLCSPTRAALMTGHYAYRCNVVNTGGGMSTLSPKIKALPEYLKDAGYTTALYGKWHLGDTYPHRAQDRGFDDVLTHISGNLSAYPPLNPYSDPVMLDNGVEKQLEGYCSDIFTDKSIDFIKKNKDQPFFLYLSYNAPHRPLEITDDYLEKYQAKGLKDQTARVYAMVENIDDNLARLRATLKELGLEDNTILVFMNDNGPTSLEDDRYLGGFRGKKTYVYEGGIKAACAIAYPNGFAGKQKIDALSAHIDFTPTILDLCGVDPQEALEGKSLKPLLMNEKKDLEERTLFWQQHQKMPQKFRAFAVRKGDYKLVQQEKINGTFKLEKINFELFNIKNDPFEKNNIIGDNPAIKAELLAEYEQWFDEVTLDVGDLPYTIILQPSIQNPTLFTRRDWLGTNGIQDNEVGHWSIRAKESAVYDVEVSIRRVLKEASVIQVDLNGKTWEVNIPAKSRKGIIEGVKIKKGNYTLTGRVLQDDTLIGGVHYIKLIEK